MQPLQKLFQDWVKKVFSDSHASIVGIIIASIFVGGGSVYLFAKGLWDLFIQIMHSPTPLWITTSVCIVFVIVYNKKASRINSRKTHQIDIFLMEDNGLKWKVTDFKNGAFDIEQRPYCISHDTRYFNTPGGQYMCSENIGGASCKSPIIEREELPSLYEFAKIKAEKQIYNYQTKR